MDELIPLREKNLHSLPDGIKVPDYDRSQLTPGMVHIGLGNFHRAHQSWYLHRLFDQGLCHDWAIIGAGVRPPDAIQRERLKAQDCLTTLIELDPTNAEIYTANATSYLEELDALAHDFMTPMIETVSEDNRILITNHDAFGYFAARYEFEIVGTIIPGVSTLSEPSASDVAAIIDLVREEGVPAIFAETTVSDDLAQQIADETGAEIYVLYSGSLSDADEPASTYLDYMRYNVTPIVEALGNQ